MAVISCPNFLDCEGSDFPITNYSAEGPEQVPQFFSLYFPPSWDKTGCLSLCVSDISQNEADLCALAQEATCQPPGLPPMFCSTAQECTCESSGGSQFTYTTPASTFCAETQEAADALAGAYACNQCGNPAISVRLGNIISCVCIESSYSSLITYSGRRPFAWAVIDGSLPSGLILNPSTGLIQGTPDMYGTSAFTIRAFIVGGGYATRTYSIAVVKITTTSITTATVGATYSFQMQMAGGSGTYLWQILSGSLPTGLSMNAAGLISGTPTAVESHSVEFMASDQNSSTTCSCTTELTVAANSSDPCASVLTATLLAYYKCDDVAYPVIDYKAAKNLTYVSGNPFPDVEPGIIATGFFGQAGAITRYVMGNTDAQWDLTAETGFTIRAWFWYSGTYSTQYDTRIGVADGRWALIMFDPLLGPYFKFQIDAGGGYVHRHYFAIGAVGWHRVVAVFRKGCGTYLKVDNSATTTFLENISLVSGNNTFQIDNPSTIFAFPKTGIDEVGIWKGAWTEAQMLYDWNAGAGRTFPDVP